MAKESYEWPLTGCFDRATLRSVEDHPVERKDGAVTPETIRLTARVLPVRILMPPHLWPTWAEIAIDEEATARITRDEELKLATEHPDKEGVGDVLLGELRASLISIAAASHSFDALYGVLAEMVIEPDLQRTWRQKRESGKTGLPRHRQVFETIKRAMWTGPR